MTELSKELQQARPRLKLVSPLAASIMLGYGVTNILLGIGMMFYVNPSPNAAFTIINTVTSFAFWGVVFLILGVFKLYSYWKNNWEWMRLSLIGGLVVKSIWAIALFIRFLDGGSVLLLVIWMLFTYVQAMTYINFIPNIKQRLT